MHLPWLGGDLLPSPPLSQYSGSGHQGQTQSLVLIERAPGMPGNQSFSVTGSYARVFMKMATKINLNSIIFPKDEESSEITQGL